MKEEKSQEEQVELKSEVSQRVEQTDTKQKAFFSSKCKWIAFTVTFFCLTGLAIFLGIYLIQNQNRLVPTIRKNQRDDFQQQDQICFIQGQQKYHDCAEIHLNTTRVTTDVNEQNATSLLILQSLKLSQNQYNSNGTVTQKDLIEQNTKVDQDLKKLLRRLEAKNDTTSNICEGIPENECGDVNELPLLTIITDQQTGVVLKIGIPSKMSNIFLQPLVSNIIHISPNLEETKNDSITDGRRVLQENLSNLYYVGNQAFYPKTTKKTSWFGESTISKKITKDDLLEQKEGEGFDYFKKFEQSQDTTLDNNNFLISSHISTNSILDNSIKQINGNEDIQSQKSETQVSGDSNVTTSEIIYDPDLTIQLQKIQELQDINYLSIQEIQDKVYTQQQIENNLQDPKIDLEPPNGNRLLQEENGNINLTIANNQSQIGSCSEDGFNLSVSSQIVKAQIMNQNISLSIEVSGNKTNKTTQGKFQFCITLNNKCQILIQQSAFSFQNPNFYEIQLQNTVLLFSSQIRIMSYVFQIVGQTGSLSQYDQRERIQKYSFYGFKYKFYGELNIADVIAIRTGSQGSLFKGNLNGYVMFKRRNLTIEEQALINTTDPQTQTAIIYKNINLIF